MKRRVSVVAASVVFASVPLVPLVTGSGLAAANSNHRLAVTGYALGGTSSAVIASSAKALRTVTVDGVSISSNGARVERPDASLGSVRRAAHQRGLRTELLISNFSNDLGDFDALAAHALLSSRTNVARVTKAMAGYVVNGRYDGANIDLEQVQARDATGLVAFAKALQAAMPAKKSVSIDVSASTSLADYRDQGYWLGPLGRAVDVIELMAYDQHGPTWSGPGPIGDLRWQKASLKIVLAHVPASRVDLGQAGYGYTWPKTGTGVNVTDRGARARVHQDRWSAVLSNGTRLWWADVRSYAIRKTLAQSLHLHGLAVWVLGSADPLK
jgi:spore germination protein